MATLREIGRGARIVAGFAFAAGCEPADPAAPTIRITEPTDGATVCGEPAIIDVAVENFTLVAMDGEPEAGAGHIDLYLNGQTVNMGHEPPFVQYGIEDGVWRLSAELVTADHEPLEPPALDAIDVTVDNGRCEPGSS